MTELKWLVELILKHELPDKTKNHVLKRIGAVEEQYSGGMVTRSQPKPQINQQMQQAPSTLALMEKHGIDPTPPPPTSVQAAQALSVRETLIQQAMSGKPALGQNSPIKMRGPLK